MSKISEFKCTIEICEKTESDDVAGRVKIKMTALEVHKTKKETNKNGINWKRQYVKNNLKSMIGASYKVAFIDDDKTIPSGHGTMEFDVDGNVMFKDTETVGTILDAYIDTIDIDGEDTDVLMTEGYLYEQSYPNFVRWLREESDENVVYGSVEINGKGKSKKIVYADDKTGSDWGRQPKVFDFTALAILALTTPSDNKSQVIELNELEVKNVSNTVVEINELSYYDISALIIRSFRVAMIDDNVGYSCWIHKLFPESKRVIIEVNNYNDALSTYYMTTYTVEKNTLSLGKIQKSEEDWKPVEEEDAVEVNASIVETIIKSQEKKGVSTNMHDTGKNDSTIVELNSQIVEKVTKINELGQSVKEKDIEINSLKEKETELNELIVEANKKIESLTKEMAELNEEITPLRELKVEKENSEKKAEINSYFDVIKVENGFTETELNSLKETYVDKGDLDGLKKAESQLCVQKMKSLKTAEKTESELNSVKTGKDDTLFFSTKQETVETNSTDDGSELFK